MKFREKDVRKFLFFNFDFCLRLTRGIILNLYLEHVNEILQEQFKSLEKVNLKFLHKVKNFDRKGRVCISPTLVG